MPLRVAKLGFIVRKEDPLSDKETLNIEDVLDRNFILPNDAEQRYRALFSAMSNLKKNNLEISYIDNSALALRAIKRTSGIGITDFEDLPQKIEIEGCFKIPLEGDFENVYDYAVYIENSPKRNQIEHFIEWLLEKDRFLRWCPSRPISDRTESTET